MIHSILRLEPAWNHIAWAKLITLAERRGWSVVLARNWLTNAGGLDELPAILRVRSDYSDQIVTEGQDFAAILQLDGENFHATVCAAEQEGAKAGMESLRSIFPPLPAAPPDEVDIDFWFNTSNGARSAHRRIAVPSWAEIARNYPAPTRPRLNALIEAFEPAKGGQLILWHGAPGTGKTFALRSLVRAWRDWCRMEYITDPDAFFGEAHYMMQVLLKTGDGEGPAPVSGTSLSQQWRLFVLEDCGELLSSDARSRIGQGLSRFLNLVDGLIGQGLRILVLVSTNEPLGTLHAAVGRAGRCAAEIDFALFDSTEAAEWLAAHKLDSATGSQTLADRYGRLQGFGAAQVSRTPVGFGQERKAK